jgi:hypothetical protein
MKPQTLAHVRRKERVVGRERERGDSGVGRRARKHFEEHRLLGRQPL